jgi:hypothetical protein
MVLVIPFSVCCPADVAMMAPACTEADVDATFQAIEELSTCGIGVQSGSCAGLVNVFGGSDDSLITRRTWCPSILHIMAPSQDTGLNAGLM